MNYLWLIEVSHMNKEKLINTIQEITDETIRKDIYRLLHMERVEEPLI